MAWLKEFPSLGSDALGEIRRTVDGAFRGFTREHGEMIERLFDPLRDFLLASERLLTQSPWPLVVGAIALIAWLASRSLKIVVGTVITLMLIGFFGMWDDTMKTISMIFVCTVVPLVVGLPLGSLPISHWRQVMGMVMPSPMALLNASLALNRVARYRMPRSGQRALRSFHVANSASLRILSAKRSPWRS